MKYSRTVLKCFLSSLFLASALCLNAADQPDAKTTLPKASKSVPEPDVKAAWQRRIAEFGWDNFPLSAIVAELRNRFPEINFVFRQQNDTDFDIQSITTTIVLRSVTLQEILKAVEVAAQRPILITGGPDERLVVFESKSAAVAVDAAGLPLRPVIQTRVFNISRFLERSDKEEKEALAELDQVLQITGQLFTDANHAARPFKPRLHIHRGTKLLIAAGSSEELNIIEQVVNSLQDSLSSMKVPSKPERAPKGNAPGEPSAGNKQ